MELENPPIDAGSEKTLSNKKSKKVKPTATPITEFRAHSCSFLHYNPAAVECMANHPSLGLIAVGRNNNTIEVYDKNTYSVLIKLYHPKNVVVKKIIFVDSVDQKLEVEDGSFENVRLLVGTLGGYLLEYNLKNLGPIYRHLLPGGGLWDMAYFSPKNMLVTAHEDGALRLFNVESSDGYNLAGQTRVIKERAVSCCWDVNGGNFFGSYVSGLVRKFDSNGNVAFTINLKEGSHKNFAWSILSVPGGYLACGCSDGFVRIFETKFGTGVKSLQTHEADILTLVLSGPEQGNAIFASGVDSRIASIQKVSERRKQGGMTEETAEQNFEEIVTFVVTSVERGQSHDIKSLLITGENTLISGGVTTDICVYNINNGRFQDRTNNKKKSKDSEKKSKLRHITALPQHEVIGVTYKSLERIYLLYRRDFSIELWLVNSVDGSHEFLIELKTKDSPITCAALDKTATFLAYSTDEETVLFNLNKNYSLTKLTTLEPASTLQFATENYGKLLYCAIGKEQNSLKSFDIETMEKVFVDDLPGLYQFSAGSRKEKYLAIGAKLENKIKIYKVSTSQISFHYELPTVVRNAKFTSFKFTPEGKKLVVAYDNNKFVIFDVGERKLTKWSLRNIARFPQNYLVKYNRIVGIEFSPTDKNKLVVYSNFYYIVIDLKQDIPKHSRVLDYDMKAELKSRENFDIIYRRNPLLYLDYIGAREFLVVESSWEKMLEEMPDALNTKKFGF